MHVRFLLLNRYDEVCSYNWKKGGHEPEAAHFMQLIWKTTTYLGIGKADIIKNGRPFTYIVARYKPAITFDSLKNVLKGRFNPSFCRNVLALSHSDATNLTQKFNPKFNPKAALAGPLRFPNQPNHSSNKLVQTQPLPRKPRLPSTNVSFQKPEGYRNGFLNIANNNPHGKRPQQNDKLSYYAGNAWTVTNGDRSQLPATSSEYYPKEAEVVEEFVEGDEPDGKPEYESDNDKQYLRNEGPTPYLIPVMNSEDAEIDDDDISEDDLQRKAHVPQHSK